MQVGQITTPFGRRPAKLTLVRGQLASRDIKPGKAVEKWKVFRDICEARATLGLADRALAVLDALLTFYPDNMLSEGKSLVVFPSNVQLSVRAHGIAGSTLRRHLAALVDAGLIIRNDSANGKRFVRKDRAGEIETAYGFDLSPILARSEELAQAAQEVVAARKRLSVAKETLTICRRDVRKLISAAMEEGANGDWSAIEALYIDLVARIPRAPSLLDIAAVLDEMVMLREEICNLLEMQNISEKTSSNDVQNGRHIQNSNTESTYELEPSSRKEQGAKSSAIVRQLREPIRSMPLGLVLKACPEIAMMGPSGPVSSWRDLMSAAVVVRSMLGISPSAYEAACDALGPENAAVVVGCIYERGGHINSAGGYLRGLTRKAQNDEFSIGPMVMALLRTRGEGLAVAT
ncbi:plasmid replication protein RepC [Rhizobium leguminosarum]|uniref:plasmid replication protein RepC n=1 Tax=Rhizobium leguminosarum TaxID=384 RepID=UPI001C961C6A|nr:plasmid replication protein RepC [Rhizobium leguminosarum]MBY5827284.1 replication initiation protein RepC [Rhizobium leguminosarum]